MEWKKVEKKVVEEEKVFVKGGLTLKISKGAYTGNEIYTISGKSGVIYDFAAGGDELDALRNYIERCESGIAQLEAAKKEAEAALKEAEAKEGKVTA